MVGSWRRGRRPAGRAGIDCKIEDAARDGLCGYLVTADRLPVAFPVEGAHQFGRRDFSAIDVGPAGSLRIHVARDAGVGLSALEGGNRHFGLERGGVVTAGSSHSFCSWFGNLHRLLKQKYHLSPCPISRGHLLVSAVHRNCIRCMLSCSASWPAAPHVCRTSETLPPTPVR